MLYNWETSKNVCPNGWHLPSKSEYDILVMEFGGETKASVALKSTKGWISDNGNNSSGFNAFTAGQYYTYNYSFSQLGYRTFFSVSNAFYADKVSPFRIYFPVKNEKIYHDLMERDREDGFSVRFVKD